METNTSALAKFEEFYAKLSPQEKQSPEFQEMAKKIQERKAQAERDAAEAKLLESVNAAFGMSAKSFKEFATQYLKKVSPKKKRAKPLSDEQIASIKKMFADGKSPADIAKATGFKYAQVFKLKPKKIRSTAPKSR